MNRTPESCDARPPLKGRRPGWRVGLLLLASLALVGIGAAVVRNAPVRSTEAPTEVVPHPTASDTEAMPGRIIAYYFHTTYRCPSCRKIEAYSRMAIETAFAPELKAGRLAWRVINVDETGNKHYIKDYRLYTKSLILSDERSGREVRWKNLARVWELLGNERAFVEYVEAETHDYLDELP